MSTPPATLSAGNEPSEAGNSAPETKILSSKRVGAYLYQLVGCSKPASDGKAAAADGKHQTTTSTNQQSSKRQKARKTFPASHFQVPHPHIPGRTADKPEADAAAAAGKTLPMPQLAAMVPSPILSEEIHPEEVAGRVSKKQSSTFNPESTKNVSNMIMNSKMPENSLKTNASISSSACREERTGNVAEEVKLAGADQMPTPSPVSGVLDAIKRKSLLDLMKREYVAGLGQSNQSNELPEELTTTTETKLALQAEMVSSTETGDVSADLVPNEIDDSQARQPSSSECVIDVEAAIAALHGELFENADASRTVSPVIVDVRSIRKIAVKRKTGRPSSMAKKRRGTAARSALNSSSTTLKAAQSAGRPPGTQRKGGRTELDKLFGDEGAINMLCDMEKRGVAGRRSGSGTEKTSTPTLIPKDLLNQKTLQQMHKIRTTRIQRRNLQTVAVPPAAKRARKADYSTKTSSSSKLRPVEVSRSGAPADGLFGHWQQSFKVYLSRLLF